MCLKIAVQMPSSARLIEITNRSAPKHSPAILNSKKNMESFGKILQNGQTEPKLYVILRRRMFVRSEKANDKRKYFIENAIFPTL